MSAPVANQAGSWVAMLRAVPARNTAVRVVENPRNGVTLYVKHRRPAWLVPPVSWIVPHRQEREVTLDAIGRQIWEWCDGRSTVEVLVDRFRVEYRLTFHEARAAVAGYLKLLIQRGILAVIMQEES